jgi:hypothetical protein
MHKPYTKKAKKYIKWLQGTGTRLAYGQFLKNTGRGLSLLKTAFFGKSLDFVRLCPNGLKMSTNLHIFFHTFFVRLQITLKWSKIFVRLKNDYKMIKMFF